MSTRENRMPQRRPVPNHVPRFSQFMALAIRFAQLIRAGEIIDGTETARLGHVTRARMTQSCTFCFWLAPDLPE